MFEHMIGQLSSIRITKTVSIHSKNQGHTKLRLRRLPEQCSSWWIVIRENFTTPLIIPAVTPDFRTSDQSIVGVVRDGKFGTLCYHYMLVKIEWMC